MTQVSAEWLKSTEAAILAALREKRAKGRFSARRQRRREILRLLRCAGRWRRLR